MATKRILLMHFSNFTGHRCASQAIEKALQEIGTKIQTFDIDALNYTNSYLGKLIYNIYIFVITTVPKVWDYFYDNEDVLRRIRKVRSLIHRLNEKKIKKLFDDFKPNIVVCTQAFPCGLVAEYKRRHKLSIPLMGVLTDYAPHAYWLNDFVDIYVVPAVKIKQKLIQRGISGERLKTLGIPIDTRFIKQSNRAETFRQLKLDPDLAVILIMGGGQGLGPIKKIGRTLDKLNHPVQLIVVCGTNRNLYKWFKKNESNFIKPLSIIGYTEQINNLMDIASFIVSKPGGLTSAEALSKSLPIIIVNPLPGQESQNTQFLLEAGAALQANGFGQLRSLAEELLSDTTKLEKLRKNTSAFIQADSALKIAQLILSIIESRNVNRKDAISSV